MCGRSERCCAEIAGTRDADELSMNADELSMNGSLHD